MNRNLISRHILYYGRRSILWSVWLVMLVSFPEDAFSVASDTSQQEAQQGILALVQTAETLLKNERYPEGLRKLYDALYLEKENHLYEDVYSHIYTVKEFLLYQDQSSLMQYLRNKDIPFQEKNLVLQELETIAKQAHLTAISLIQGKYTGPLMTILTSPELRIEEKDEIIQNVIYEVRKQYISEEQKSQELDHIYHNLAIADQKMHDKQYAEAFRLFDESDERAQAIGEYMAVSDGFMEFLDFFASREASPMMQFLRDTTVSLQEKEMLFAELASLAQGQTLKSDMKLAQEQFRGPLTALMLDATLTVSQRLGLLDFVREVIEKEYSPVP